jgi:flap endonuclease-1
MEMNKARLNDFFKPIPKTPEELETIKKKNDEKNAEKKRRTKAAAEAKKGSKKPKLGS